MHKRLEKLSCFSYCFMHFDIKRQARVRTKLNKLWKNCVLQKFQWAKMIPY